MPDIWDKWKAHYTNKGIDPGRICKDGVLNDDKFKETNPKVLFVMKEVNDWEGGDLRKMLKDGPKYQMWHTTARWATGILQQFPPYEQIDNYASMRDALSRVATINLKKTSGGSYANISVINAYAHLDRYLLLEQVSVIQPNLILACGTIDILIWLLNLETNPDKLSGKPIRDKKRNAWIIPWKHPARVNNCETYTELKKVMSKIA